MNRYQIFNLNKNTPKVNGAIEPIRIIEMGADEASDLILNGNKLPQHVHVTGDLWLNRLTSAAGLVLPQSLTGNLCLDGLTDIDGLSIPEHIISTRALVGELVEALKLCEVISQGNNCWPGIENIVKKSVSKATSQLKERI